MTWQAWQYQTTTFRELKENKPSKQRRRFWSCGSRRRGSGGGLGLADRKRECLPLEQNREAPRGTDEKLSGGGGDIDSGGGGTVGKRIHEPMWQIEELKDDEHNWLSEREEEKGTF
ncbi:hypothetical protein PIB30_062859 [Stylosanthes scabra]|uniref:Uncharacterized protein n=1 Tax=Stylosanthes scabra TaxID=79078 RepID=A0ABU6ZJY2_9FABA|nr:hypothetical protein [Stylosanthes scabra]